MSFSTELEPIRYKNLILLFLSQVLGGSGAPIMVLVGGLVGAELAPSPTLATLPVSIMVVGVAISTLPAAWLLRQVGRRRGYMLGSGLGLAAALLAAFAIGQQNFVLFCLASLLIGSNGAFLQQYRFAAVESVPAARSGQAVSFVLLGGMVSGYLGPEIARRSQNWLDGEAFRSGFIILAGLYVCVIVLLNFLQDTYRVDQVEDDTERPMLEIMSQPTLIIAIFAGAIAYGVMSLIMTATPVEMHTMHGFSLADTAWVIQSHIIAMYLPSFFTGLLFTRFGERQVMLIGVFCLLACVILGLVSDVLFEFWGALVLLGVGWNFLFVGGTVLLTRCYRPAERFKVQAVNDFTVFGIQAITSLSAGVLLFQASWDALLLANLPVLLLMLILLAVMIRRFPQTAAA
jgi:MFS family permease